MKSTARFGFAVLSVFLTLCLFAATRSAYADDPFGVLIPYFANLHSHTVYSDDARLPPFSDTPDGAFGEAKGLFRLFQLLDIMAVTDHAELLTPHAYHDAVPGWDLLDIGTGCISKWPDEHEANQWGAIADAATRATDDRFLGLRGFEWSADGGQLDACDNMMLPVWPANKSNIGHINVFGTSDYVAHHYISLTDDPSLQKGTLREFFEWVDFSAAPETDGLDIVCQFNHPNSYSQTPFQEQYNFGYGMVNYGLNRKPLAVYPKIADPNGPFALIELNGHKPTQKGLPIGPEDVYNLTTNVDIWQTALQRGWHLAPTFNEDNHMGYYGHVQDFPIIGEIIEPLPLRTGVWALDLSKKQILHALRKRHVYATNDPTLRLKFWVDSPAGPIKMGEQASVDIRRSVTFHVVLDSQQVFQTFPSVQLIPIRATVGTPGPGRKGQGTTRNGQEYQATFTPPSDIVCYYVRVELGNGGMAFFSAPIWLVDNLPAPTGLKATAQNGSVYLTWNIVPAATHYYVYRSTTPGGEGNLAVQN